MSLTVKDLHQTQTDTNNLRLHVYTSVYEDCLNKLQYNNDILKKTNFHYEIPPLFYGYPMYNTKECICHLVYWLRRAGYIVIYRYPYSLFIDWKLTKPTTKNFIPLSPSPVPPTSTSSSSTSTTPNTNSTPNTTNNSLSLLIKKKNPVKRAPVKRGRPPKKKK